MDRDELYLSHIVELVRRYGNTARASRLNPSEATRWFRTASCGSLRSSARRLRMVSETTRKDHPDIPWYEIAGMRNRLIHEYFGVDLAVVWKTVTEDLEILVEKFDAKA